MSAELHVPGDDRTPRAQRQQVVNRRLFLGITAGGVASLSLMLAGCTPAAPAGSGASKPTAGATPGAAAKKSNIPTYVPAKVPTPDFPSNEKGYEAAYVNFPKELTKSVTEVPAKGGEINGMVLWGVNALPTPVDKNSGWQALNKALGTDLKINMVPQSDYAAKWATVTAGSDLPDIMYVSIVPTLPNVPAFQKAACVDLTPNLGGDAVKEYPNLAAIPPASWRVAMLDGAVYGVPIPRPVTGWPMYVQQTLLDQMGIGTKYPANADDFKAFCKELNKPEANRWAFGVTNDSTTGPYSMTWFQGVFRAPNNWRQESGGKLVKDIETEEYKAALAYLRDLVALGYVSPDVKSNAELNNDLFGGRIVMRANAWNGYQNLYVDQASTLKLAFRIIPPFGHDGKPGTNLLGPGNFGYAIVKKASADRVKELLRVMNYLAAPFGSEEYMLSKFGVKDQDYKLNEKGSPVFTDQGKANMPGSPTTPWSYLANPFPVIFSPVVSEYGNFGHADEVKMIDLGVGDPTYGQFSQTAADKGAVLDRLIFDRVSGIAAGRAPMSDLDQLVKDWKAQGGDTVREELQKALQNA
jgi:putative aldouronate transport system substrate-binding protein